jgi:hypothetical protein
MNSNRIATLVALVRLALAASFASSARIRTVGRDLTTVDATRTPQKFVPCTEELVTTRFICFRGDQLKQSLLFTRQSVLGWLQVRDLTPEILSLKVSLWNAGRFDAIEHLSEEGHH